MLVYDITNEKSFDNIKNWIRNIEEHASSDVDRMIIGNKCDVEERRQVSRERGEQVSLVHDVCTSPLAFTSVTLQFSVGLLGI